MSKTILITGASSGLGRITAEAMAHAGHMVFASMRDPNAKNRNHARELRQRGIAVVELDISSDTSVDYAVKEVLADGNATAAERIAAVTAGAKLLAIKHKLSSDDEKNFFTK